MDKTRMQQYMSQMRAMFNKHALYSDESPQYQIPFEPNPGDTVKIRFRTLKNKCRCGLFHQRFHPCTDAGRFGPERF